MLLFLFLVNSAAAARALLVQVLLLLLCLLARSLIHLTTFDYSKGHALSYKRIESLGRATRKHDCLINRRRGSFTLKPCRASRFVVWI